MRFKVGDRVRIRTDSRFHGLHQTCNPTNEVIGVIVDLSRHGMDYCVDWPNGSNWYNEKDLDMVGDIEPNKYIERHEFKSW
jgi:hypothetical protein